MMISTRGRYALRVLIDLAQHEDAGYISLKEISGRQGLSVKYLEAIVPALCKGGLLRSQRGKDGGYLLARAPARISVGEVIRLTEGKLAPVSCLECGENTCEEAERCLTLPMWERLDGLIGGYLESVTIQDILDGNIEKRVEQ